MEVIKQLILNLALILVILFSLQTWHESRNGKSVLNWHIFIYFLISIIISILLSTKLNSQVRFDLRGVPLIVGGIYLGRLYAILLFCCTIFFRAIFGINQGFWASSLIYLCQTIMIIILYSRFHRLTVRKKIGVNTIISVFISICFIITMTFLHQEIPLFEWIFYIIFSAIGSSMVTAIIESWRRSRFLIQKIMKTEKIEAISQMSAAISHEVRNPLTTVRGFLQLLRDKGIEETKRNEYIEIALLEIMRAEDIIKDYLSFAKPSLERSDEINVGNELKQAINIIKGLANINTIEINLSLKPDIFVVGDYHRFTQCLVNILKNATEAMPHGGKLSVSCFRNDHEACVIISDTGVGMTHEQISRLGEPYYSTKGSNGTGLGMMVSFGIIRAMNGRMVAESEVGKGTSFYMTLPLKKGNLTSEKIKIHNR